MNDSESIREQNIIKCVQTFIQRLSELADDDDRARVLRTVSTFYGIQSNQPHVGHQTVLSSSRNFDAGAPSFVNREELPPKEFLFQKQPKTDVERIACLAYYLAHYRDTPHIKTIDISKLNTEAAQPKFSNTAYSLANATKARLLVGAGKGAKQISAMGERYVEALPDREAAREAQKALHPRRGRKKVTKSTKTTPK
jgi:hypothetical protein